MASKRYPKHDPETRRGIKLSNLEFHYPGLSVGSLDEIQRLTNTISAKDDLDPAGMNLDHIWHRVSYEAADEMERKLVFWLEPEDSGEKCEVASLAAKPGAGKAYEKIVGNDAMKTIEMQPLFDGKALGKLETALQTGVNELIALSLIIKQAHWNVRGPNFRPLHLHLDEIYAAVQAGVDEFAERLVALGVPVNGLPGHVAKSATVLDIPMGFRKDTEIAQLITDRLTHVIRAVRSEMDKIEDEDTVTADLMHATVMGLEKHLWMIRSTTE